MDLEIRIEGEGESRTVRLSGSSDLASAPRLREALMPLRPPDVSILVLDLSDLEHLDSTGLGVVLGALRRLREGGGELIVTGAHGAVRRLLELLGLDRVLRFEP